MGVTGVVFGGVGWGTGIVMGVVACVITLGTGRWGLVFTWNWTLSALNFRTWVPPGLLVNGCSMILCVFLVFAILLLWNMVLPTWPWTQLGSFLASVVTLCVASLRKNAIIGLLFEAGNGLTWWSCRADPRLSRNIGPLLDGLTVRDSASDFWLRVVKFGIVGLLRATD